jgi:hypothetical protein
VADQAVDHVVIVVHVVIADGDQERGCGQAFMIGLLSAMV